jgi:TonB family protein
MLNDTLDRQPPTTRTRAWIAAAALAASLPLAAATTAHEAPPPTVPRPAVALEEAAMMPTPTAPVSPAREVTDSDVAPTPRPSHVERRAAAPQPLPATLTGALFDQHNGLLPGAEIVLTSNTTGESHVAASDGEGAFTFPNLPPGTYTLVTSLRGFSRVRNVVTLAEGATLRRHIVLPLGEVQETITVAADGTVRVSQRLAREIPEPRLPAPCVGRVGGCVKPPTKTADVKPIYPSSLAAAGIGATVRLVGRVGIDGYLSDLRHDGSLGNDSSAFRPEFVSAAMEAVQQWEFNPTLLNGAPVEATINITVHFKPGAAP